MNVGFPAELDLLSNFLTLLWAITQPAEDLLDSGGPETENRTMWTIVSTFVKIKASIEIQTSVWGVRFEPMVRSTLFTPSRY